MLRFFKRTPEKLPSDPFPVEWRQMLEKNFPFYRLLPEELRRELEITVRQFLTEKNFEGCGGLQLTDEIKVTIAAQACLLLLGRDTECYPELRSILVYPSTYVANAAEARGEIVSEAERARLGESWDRGVVVLSWDSTVAGAINMFDGQNVALHEFAHQLDQEDGVADGAPILTESFLQRRPRYLAWARVLGEEYKTLCAATEKGRKTVMDSYGATNPAEFFAVATECFFEKPRQMQQKHPKLYEELKGFYQQDPVMLVP